MSRLVVLLCVLFILYGLAFLSVCIITIYSQDVNDPGERSSFESLVVVLPRKKSLLQRQIVTDKTRLLSTTTTLMSSTTSLNRFENITGDLPFSPQVIRDTAKMLSRHFPLRNETSTWCFQEKQHRPHWKMGLFFVKTKKASSSTAAGALLRIIQHQRPRCQALELEHRYGREYSVRSRNESFLLGIVRDPAKRSLSQIFYSMVSLQNITPSDANVMSWLKTHREVSFNFQLRYLSPVVNPKLDVTNKAMLGQYIKRILKLYDFILLAERMDESLVALSMILGLPSVSQVLTTPSKISGTSYQLYNTNNHRHSASNHSGCVLLQKPFMSRKVSNFLKSKAWHDTNYGDYLLHQAVDWSLDRTIRALGRDLFQKQLKEYRRLQSAMTQHCFASTNTADDQTAVVFPCSPNGTEQSERSKTSCYWRDFGCGYPCIDRTLQKISSSSAYHHS